MAIMPSTIETLSEYADSLLQVCEDSLALTAEGVPPRVYVSPGIPAFDCLVGSTMVSCERGAIPISEVAVGDRVWSYLDGELVLRPVLSVQEKGEQEVFRVASRRRDIVGTANHRLVRIRPTIKGKNTHSGKPQSWVPEWVEIANIERGDVLVSLEQIAGDGKPQTLPDGTKLTDDVAWLLGLWIGDGWLDRSGPRWSVYGDQRRRAADVLSQTWECNPREGQDHVRVSSLGLRQLFEDVCGDRSAREKRVPEIIWGAEQNVMKSFLEGYADADAYRRPEGYIAYACSSSRLASEVRSLHIAVGDNVSNLSVEERTKPIKIKEKVVKDAASLHRFSAYPASTRKNQWILDYRGARRLLSDPRLGVTTVSSVREAGVEMTYDIEVEETHNFVANGLIAHNCEQLTLYISAINEAPTSPLAPPEESALRGKFGNVILVSYIIDVVRCSANSESLTMAPSPAALTAVAHIVQDDMFALWNGLRHAHADGLIFDRCLGVHFDGITPLRDQGGYCGCELRVRASIPGIPNA